MIEDRYNFRARGGYGRLKAVSLLVLAAFGVGAYAGKVVSQQPPPVAPLAQTPAPAPITVKWHDAKEFAIEGKGWTDTELFYDRFPARAHGSVVEKVWGLSRHSAGLCVRFKTNAPVLYVDWSLVHADLTLPIMSATAASGVDLYMRLPNGLWRHEGVGSPTQKMGNLVALRTGVFDSAMTEMLLYLPTQNGVLDLQLAVRDQFRLENVVERPESKRQPIVYYGTSIVQGVGSSRPGMAFVSIVSRALDRPIINLGFAGSALIEPEVVQLLAELTPIVYVIDALWNAHNLPEAVLAARIEAAARTLRLTHPDTPILFVGESSADPSRLPAPSSIVQEGVIRKLQQEGLRDLYLMDAAKLYTRDGDGSVDGVHPNDYGMMAHARAMVPALQRLIALKK